MLGGNSVQEFRMRGVATRLMSVTPHILVQGAEHAVAVTGMPSAE
jgi:hypothetical protein